MTDDRNAVRTPTIGLGFITPSGNVVVERVTTAILRSYPHVSGHFSRVSVVGSADAYAEDYDWDGMLRAAELLGHAAPACICWNGSKGGSIGFEKDRKLCERITELTGLAATTSTLAIEQALRATGARRLALVTPYTETYGRKIPPHFAAAGYEIVAQAHAGVSDNLSYAAIPDDDIVAMVSSVTKLRPDAVITYCTNFPAAHLVHDLERQFDVPVYDSVSAGVWGALQLSDITTGPGDQWGRLFGTAVRLTG